MTTHAKLTLSIDKETLEKAKIAAEQKHLSLSGIVEGFLRFFTDPNLYCFKCGKKFSRNDSQLCPKCGWLICPDCRVCRCSLSEETAVAIFQMRLAYEDLLSGRVK